MSKPDYRDYGPGRELRELVDQLDDAHQSITICLRDLREANKEVARINRVMAALASEQRRKKR